MSLWLRICRWLQIWGSFGGDRVVWGDRRLSSGELHSLARCGWGWRRREGGLVPSAPWPRTCLRPGGGGPCSMGYSSGSALGGSLRPRHLISIGQVLDSFMCLFFCDYVVDGTLTLNTFWLNVCEYKCNESDNNIEVLSESKMGWGQYQKCSFINWSNLLQGGIFLVFSTFNFVLLKTFS